MRDKEITRRNFALSRFFKNFDIVSDIPKQIFVVPVRPFGYFPAVDHFCVKEFKKSMEVSQ